MFRPIGTHQYSQKLYFYNCRQMFRPIGTHQYSQKLSKILVIPIIKIRICSHFFGFIHLIMYKLPSPGIFVTDVEYLNLDIGIWFSKVCKRWTSDWLCVVYCFDFNVVASPMHYSSTYYSAVVPCTIVVPTAYSVPIVYCTIVVPVMH